MPSDTRLLQERLKMAQPGDRANSYERTAKSYFVYQGIPKETTRPYIRQLAPVITGHHFGLPDLKDSGGSQFLYTTLFWDPKAGLDEKGEAQVTILANDLKDRFAIRMQGIKGNNFIDEVPAICGK